MTLITPADLFPASAGAPTRRPIDVRSPVEVARGAIPGALALPILTDLERHEVGLRYAEEGQDAAIAEAERRAAHDMPRRVEGWRRACQERPSAFVCWRGGMRSERARDLTGHAATPRVEGGYKAIRAYLTSAIPPALDRRRTLVVTGPTGSGKTELLTAAAGLPDLLALDLEGAAEHRGSAFGGLGPQPAQATFEHRLALPLVLGSQNTLLIEDESRNVGRVHLPEAVYAVVRSSPLLELQEPLAMRVARIHRDYALAPARSLGEAAAYEFLGSAILRLRPRLGSVLVDRLIATLREAHEADAWDEVDAFRPIIEPLLTEYYDPLYRKATRAGERPVLARGRREELLAWLANATAISPA